MILETATTAPDVKTSSLSSPVGALMRQTTMLGVGDSLGRAAHEMRLNGIGMAPVVADLTVVGIVTERTLATALADGVDMSESVERAKIEATTIRPYQTAAEALRMLATGTESTLVVVDDFGQLMGVVSASDLYPRRHSPPRPAMVGGMATPFGVYLTTGGVSAGAGTLGLMATGATMFLMLATGVLITWFGLTPLEHVLPEWALAALESGLPILLFLLFMRLVPLSGIHAAEHQVVHAIEREEELRPDIVRRMPRVHPRCGTNLATGAGLFSAIAFIEWIPSQELRITIAAIVTLYFWKRVGSLMQFYVTTKKPTEKQLAAGVKVGRELLDNFSRTRVGYPSPLQRLLRSGLLQVMAGSFLMSGVLYLVSILFWNLWKIDLPFRELFVD